MAETANLTLPLLAASQAQKHVTVNEALTRLDALYMLAVESRAVTAPPAASEGDRYVVPASATGEWAGQAPAIAVFVNGGWDYVTPQVGWRAWVADEGAEIVFASGVWSALVAPVAGGGALSELSFEHAVTAGASNVTSGEIPAGATVFAVTARVVEAISGASGWSLGVEGLEARYGAGHGASLNSAVSGACGAPLAYGAATPLKLTAEGGSFSGGRVAFTVHYWQPSVPDPV